LLTAAVRGAVVPNGTLGGSSSPGIPGAVGSAESPTGSSLGGPTAGLGSSTSGVSSGTPGTPGSDDDILARGQDMSMRMLRLQEAISEENRRYTALSNVLHARHEMAKNAIGNIR
jgi:hypothetical protein